MRDTETAAVCLSEAIAHGAFAAVGFRMAEPYAVVVSRPFADDVTSQFDFDPAVVAGRHWGTRLITDSFEAEFVAEMVQDLADQTELFLLYVMDEMLAYRDRVLADGRAKHGNILIVTDGRARLQILPIDQSDCFGHPSTLCSTERLGTARDSHFARGLPGMEGVVIEGGAVMVDRVFQRILDQREAVVSAVEIPPDEWYGQAGIDPDAVAGFLRHRLDNLDRLARRTHWRGMAAAAQGGPILEL